MRKFRHQVSSGDLLVYVSLNRILNSYSCLPVERNLRDGLFIKLQLYFVQNQLISQSDGRSDGRRTDTPSNRQIFERKCLNNFYLKRIGRER